MSEYSLVEKLENGDISVITDGDGIEIFKTISDAINSYIDYSISETEVLSLSEKSDNKMLSNREEEKYWWGIVANDVIEALNELGD